MDIKSKAYKLFFSNSYLNRATLRIDRRTKEGRQVVSMILEMDKTIDKSEVLQKRKERFELNKIPSFVNIFERGIVKDYCNNRDSVVQVTDERLVFVGGRNHWASSDKDKEILKSIIKRRVKH